ncbi:hypothetical protein [Geodermatophilus marinus]|uniref:hypothetical protein n=1 Tax=Geodermatophilus sp. LHW52908 TaxID=2303986 RepID=UPI000E3D6BAE|nr:hypothetical protein [Geodermatophilus sp. LHW52908]RFU21040.1 hypothetical protein D0Z06_13240 [Geodermatophilus sp. LHW52908]
MSAPTLVTGRPSPAHEARVDLLATLARLAGHVAPIDALPDGSRPDVALVRPGDRSLFLGDAKATETPRSAETLRRLRQYTAFLGQYVAAGGLGVFALAVPTVERYGWLRVLQDVCTEVVNGPAEARLDVIDAGCAVVWEAFLP